MLENRSIIREDHNFNCYTAIKFLASRDEIQLPFKKAYQFFDFLEEAKEKKTKYSELEVGDIICWRKTVIPQKGDTGHLAVVVDILGDGVVRVYDCSSLPHDNDEGVRPGLGEGDLKIILKDDEMTGFIWSSEHKKTKFTKVLAISHQDLKKLF